MKELDFIDYDISLPNKIPTYILDQLNKLEYYNKEGDSVCYYDRWDDLIILAKKCNGGRRSFKKKLGNYRKTILV